MYSVFGPYGPFGGFVRATFASLDRSRVRRGPRLGHPSSITGLVIVHPALMTSGICNAAANRLGLYAGTMDDVVSAFGNMRRAPLHRVNLVLDLCDPLTGVTLTKHRTAELLECPNVIEEAIRYLGQKTLIEDEVIGFLGLDLLQGYRIEMDPDTKLCQLVLEQPSLITLSS